jgi:hypothetical protein
MHYDVHGWLVGWVPRRGLCFSLHWPILNLEGPSHTKCYYFQLHFLIAWDPQLTYVGDWIEKGRKNTLIKLSFK